MIVVMGTIRLGPGEIDRLAEEMRMQMAATQAEDGCVAYVFSRSVTEPDTLLISERWRDEAALTAHFQAPHMATFNAVIGSAQILGLSVKAYTVSGVRTLLGAD